MWGQVFIIGMGILLIGIGLFEGRLVMGLLGLFVGLTATKTLYDLKTGKC
ncbi:hypothetical protein [Marinimicrobium koreense]|tara:strand:+ start:698 stop:847 length:150 start_codon:yes stop_codon:yes gene_type:complete